MSNYTLEMSDFFLSASLSQAHALTLLYIQSLVPSPTSASSMPLSLTHTHTHTHLRFQHTDNFVGPLLFSEHMPTCLIGTCRDAVTLFCNTCKGLCVCVCVCVCVWLLKALH